MAKWLAAAATAISTYLSALWGVKIKGLDRRSRRKDSGGKEPASDEEKDREDRERELMKRTRL